MIRLPETRWTYGIELSRFAGSWYLDAYGNNRRLEHPLTPRETFPFRSGTPGGTPPCSTITEYSTISELSMSAAPKLTPQEESILAEAFSKIVEKMVLHVLTGGYPLGYDQRTGMPGAYRLDAKPSHYGSIINLEGVT